MKSLSEQTEIYAWRIEGEEECRAIYVLFEGRRSCCFLCRRACVFMCVGVPPRIIFYAHVSHLCICVCVCPIIDRKRQISHLRSLCSRNHVRKFECSRRNALPTDTADFSSHISSAHMAHEVQQQSTIDGEIFSLSLCPCRS